MSNTHDFVTGAEFKRWMDEEAAFRQRLDARRASDHKEIMDRLDRIDANGREANGKTAEHSRLIAVMIRDIEALKSGEDQIERTIESIRDDGCSQYAHHVSILQAGGSPTTAAMVSLPQQWTPKQKAAAGAGVTVLLVPAIMDLVQGLTTLVAFLHEKGFL